MKKAKKLKSLWELAIILGAILTIFTSVPAPALAQSIQLTAVCRIPAIPGVNAPLLENQTTTTVATGSEKTSQNNVADAQQAPTQGQLPTIMQEEAAPTAPVAIVAPVSTQIVTRTLYSR